MYRYVKCPVCCITCVTPAKFALLKTIKRLHSTSFKKPFFPD